MGIIKIRAWVITSVILPAILLAIPAHAATIDIGEQIKNGDFNSGLTEWSTTGTAQVRPASDVINTKGGSAGFNSFFSTSFVALGDLSGDIVGQPWDSPQSISQTFTLSSTIGGDAVSSYDITISFRTAFDGRDSTGDTHDIFSATLSGLTLFTQNSSPFPDGVPSINAPNNQLVNNPYKGYILGLLPGTYTLTFLLNEAMDPNEAIFTNTAAGIDMVSVIGTAETVPVPEPSTMLLLGSGLLGLVGCGWRRLKK